MLFAHRALQLAQGLHSWTLAIGFMIVVENTVSMDGPRPYHQTQHLM